MCPLSVPFPRLYTDGGLGEKEEGRNFSREEGISSSLLPSLRLAPKKGKEDPVSSPESFSSSSGLLPDWQRLRRSQQAPPSSYSLTAKMATDTRDNAGGEKEGTRLPSAMAERRGERERRGKTTNGAMIYHFLSSCGQETRRASPRRRTNISPRSSSNAAHSNPIQENKTAVVDTHFSPPSLFPATNPIAPRLVSPQSYISYLPIPEDISTVFV